MGNEIERDAALQVDAFIAIFRSRYGLSDDDIHGILQQLAQLQRRSETARKLGIFTIQTLIVAVVAAFLSGIGWAIRHYVLSLKAG